MKSPEKRKFSENVASGGQTGSGFEKRRSYAEAVANEFHSGETGRPKRWSLAESKVTELSGEDGEDSTVSGPSIHISQH